jgi:hypothetical protein
MERRITGILTYITGNVLLAEINEKYDNITKKYCRIMQYPAFAHSYAVQLDDFEVKFFDV